MFNRTITQLNHVTFKTNIIFNLIVYSIPFPSSFAILVCSIKTLQVKNEQSKKKLLVPYICTLSVPAYTNDPIQTANMTGSGLT